MTEEETRHESAKWQVDQPQEREQIANTGVADPTAATVQATPAQRSQLEPFDPQNEAYRSHYQANLAGGGYPYEYFLPAYRYGHALRANPRFYNMSWEQMEGDVRTDWERQYPGTWERFKTSIRHAWDEVTG